VERDIMTAQSVLVTGATGTLGSLATTALLRESDVHVVAPVRPHHAPDAVATIVERELGAFGEAATSSWRDRLHQVVLPAGADDPDGPDPLGGLDEVVAQHQVDEVVHCAGCLSYFDQPKLTAVNIEMTRRFVAAAKRWRVNRFVHISTAFACGFVEGPIAEELHTEPAEDPTFYTESKRRGEWIVAEGGVPFLILRPSVVLGDSRDGHYHGPRYGLYQLWSGMDRLLLDEWHEEIHYVAPRQPIPLLHQDAFQSGFMAARRDLADNSICHLTSQSPPSVRDLAELAIQRHLHPNTARFYERLADVPIKAIPEAQRSFLRLAAINVEISSRKWQFDTTTLDHLVESGTPFAEATIETVERCQETFLRGSARLADYTARYAASFPAETLIAEGPA
jgi:nucleoside-diphosphate-sugar epimerase